MICNERVITKMMLSFSATLLIVPAVNAASPAHTDYFSVQTNSSNKTSSTTNQQPISIVGWFESYDHTVATLRPSVTDKAILARPFNKEAERVEEWTKVASKVAKNYRLLAQNIRNMTPPSNAPELKTYRDLRADWYQDAAGIYEDLIRPCHPAKTIEELQDQLQGISKRADGLKTSGDQLNAMDVSLREQYKVHPPKEDDGLQKFISGN